MYNLYFKPNKCMYNIAYLVACYLDHRADYFSILGLTLYMALSDLQGVVYESPFLQKHKSI